MGIFASITPCAYKSVGSSFGGEAVYPCGCRETRCTTLCVGIELLCCPQDKPVSVGAGRHPPGSLGKGVLFAPAAAEEHRQTGERLGCARVHSFAGELRLQLGLALKPTAGF